VRIFAAVYVPGDIAAQLIALLASRCAKLAQLDNNLLQAGTQVA